MVVTCFAVGCGGSTDVPSTSTDAATSDTTASGDTAMAGDTATAGDTAMAGDAAGQEKMICDALASRSACPGGAIACEADIKCIYGRLMLPAAATAYASCRAAPSCKTDDVCVAEAGKAVGGAAADKFTTDCAARLMACAGGFKDDYCFAGLFAYPGAGVGGQECLAKPCDQITMCMANIQAVKDIAACK